MDLKIVPLKPKKLKFKPGQEVWLVVEGPVMAVETCDEENTTCVWFDSEGNEPLRGKFLTSSLKRYVEPKPEPQPPAPASPKKEVVFTPTWSRKKPRR